MQGKGILLVVSGPSGVGKGTICSQLLQQLTNVQYSVSATTREPRPGEVNGVNYFFVTVDEFSRLREAGELLESAEVFGNLYGTPKPAVMQALEQGKDVVLEIDIQGALQVKVAFPECVTVFVWPPSHAELQRRIRQRGTESPESLLRRLREAKREMAHVVDYDYVVVNHPGQVEVAVEEMRTIIRAEKSRVARHIPWLEQVLREVSSC